jgi:DNA repair protein RadC
MVPMFHQKSQTLRTRGRHISRHEGPRERLLNHGADVVTDTELLAILLDTGVAGTSALELANHLLQEHRGLSAILAASTLRLSAVRGIGPAKAARLKVVAELARRAVSEEIERGNVMTSPQAVRDYLRLSLAALPHEVFMILFLDSQHRLLVAEELFRGTLAQTSVYPREVVKAALAHNAAAVILAHNHPSGVAEPSRADELLTQALKQALALVDVRTLDHFVVAGSSVVSFAERGLL